MSRERERERERERAIETKRCSNANARINPYSPCIPDKN